MNEAVALLMHSSNIVTGERLAIGFLLIALIGMVTYREHRKSTRLLAIAIILQIIALTADSIAFSYDINGKGPLPLIYLSYFISYTFVHLILIPFALYVRSFIEEKAPVGKWLFRIPIILSAISIIVLCAAIFSGSVYGYVNGKIAVVGDTPVIVRLIQFAIVIYLPCAAFTKRKQIGIKAVLLLGMFGIIPAVVMFINFDYSMMVTAYALIIVYILLQCDTSADKEKQKKLLENYNKELSDMNLRLEDSAAEQEAQIEEITALNTELEERQAQLEEASAEQEAQIEEITALNTELQEQRDKVSDSYGLIKALSQEYHTICIVNKDTRKMRLVRTNGISAIKEAVRLGNDYPDYDTAFSKYIETYVVPEDRERMSFQINSDEVINQLSKSNLYSVNYLRCTEEGTIGYHQISFANADTEDGRGRFVFGLRDVDAIVKAEELQKQELAEAREAAEAANRAKSVFLFNMSHDIRTPMNAILGFTQLMENAGPLSEQQRDYLGKINNSGAYLLNVINDILDMARIESGKLELDESFCDLLDEGNNSAMLLSSEISAKKLTYTSNIDVKHRYVFSDTGKTKQIIMNIVSNAVKYTPEGGSITCDFREIPCGREGYARFVYTVSDTGIGMSKEFLDRIFDSFTREKTTTESAVKGTGLGMAIVKRLVDLMGGTIEIQSEPGKGSTFIITTDLKIVENPELYINKHTDKERESFSLKGKRILLAEDNELNAEIAGIILEEEGAEVEIAGDGVICVDMLRKSPSGYYDLILMDVQMPNMNGYDAARSIRGMENTAKAAIPIIAMTANAFEEDKRNALASGMNGHIAKPIDKKKLMDTLSDILRQ